MKGGMPQSPWAVWAVIIFVTIGVAVIFFLRIQYVDYAAFLKTPPEKLKAIEAANSIRSCFQGGKPYVTRELLEQHNGKDISDVCGFSNPHADAYVLDTETGQQWQFGFHSYVNSPDHEVWIAIAYSNFDEIKDAGYAFSGEYVIRAKWFNVGTVDIRPNDVMLEFYPSAMYPGGTLGMESVQPTKVREWIEGMIKNGKTEDVKKVNLPGIGVKIMDMMPGGYALKECKDVGDLLSHEACVKVFKGVNEVHLGRLYVDVSL